MSLTDWVMESLNAIRHKSQQEWRSLASTRSGVGTLRLDLQTFVNRNRRLPCCMQFFHLYPLLCVGEPHDVSLWNWRSGQHVGEFSNFGVSSSSSNLGYANTGRISALQTVNPLTHGFLLTGTDTGEVRIFDCNIATEFDMYGGQLASPGLSSSISAPFFPFTGSDNCYDKWKPRLVTAWSPAYDVTRFGTDGTRPRTEYFWEQDAALLFVAGDFKVLRVWDARREQKIQEFSVGTDQRAVTSISADYQGHSLVAIGTSDGDVRVYDHRIPPDENRIMKLQDLDKPLVKVHLQRKWVGSQLVAASEDGGIRVWDPRMFQDPVVSRQLEEKSSSSSPNASFNACRISAMDVHEEYELMALATAETHTVHVLHMNGKTINTIRYHDGYMGQKLSDIRSLKFHPHLITLGLGSVDNVVATYGVSA